MAIDDHNGWLRYSSIGLEMALIVGICVWCGVAIDKRHQGQFPLFTILLSMLGLLVSIIYLVKTTKK